MLKVNNNNNHWYLLWIFLILLIIKTVWSLNQSYISYHYKVNSGLSPVGNEAVELTFIINIPLEKQGNIECAASI